MGPASEGYSFSYDLEEAVSAWGGGKGGHEAEGSHVSGGKAWGRALWSGGVGHVAAVALAKSGSGALRVPVMSLAKMTWQRPATTSAGLEGMRHQC